MVLASVAMVCEVAAVHLAVRGEDGEAVGAGAAGLAAREQARRVAVILSAR